MYIARVIGNIVSTECHPAYSERVLLLVQKLSADGAPSGLPTVAIDYVGAGPGDYVLVGAAPGLASAVFGTPRAPMRELIMGIIDQVELSGRTPAARYGNSVRPASPPLG